MPLVIGDSCGAPIKIVMRPSPSPKKKKEQSMLFAVEDTSKRNFAYPAGFAVGSPGIPRNVIASDQIRIAWVNAATNPLYNSAQKSQVLKKGYKVTSLILQDNLYRIYPLGHLC